MTKFKPTIITDGGPWAQHNMPCSVYHQSEGSILNLNTGVFEPSRKAAKEGWRTVKIDSWLKKIVFNLFIADHWSKIK